MGEARALIPVFLLLAVGLAGCVQGDQGAGALRGQAAPAFTLTSIDNETVGTNASQGTVLFIDFMGVHCSTCNVSMRELVPLARDYGDQVDFLSVDVGSYIPGLGGKNEAQLHGYRNWHKASWPFALDTLQENTAARYEVLSLPTHVLLDANGTVACRASGVASYDHLAGWINHTLENGYDPAFEC